MPNISIGKSVLYRWRSGQVRAGQPEAAATVTRVNADGTVNLRVLQDMTDDVLRFAKVAQMSATVQSNCWQFTPDDLALEARLDALEGKRIPNKSKAA